MPAVPVMRQMAEVAERERYSVIGVMPVAQADVGSYGIVETESLEAGQGRDLAHRGKAQARHDRRPRWLSSVATF